MGYITGIFVICTVLALLRGILALPHKMTEQNSNTVKLPKFCLLVGILCSAIFLVPTIVLLKSNQPWLSFFFASFSALSASLIVAFLNCRITYDAEFFEAKNFFGLKRRYSFQEITAIRGKYKNVKLYMGKRSVTVDAIAYGKYEFIAHAKKQYRKYHQGKAIPEAKEKTDLFNGNVENPGEFLFIYILLMVILIGMLVWFSIASAPDGGADLEYALLSFSKYEFAEENLHLSADGVQPYFRIRGYAETLEDTNRFLVLCEEGRRFTVGYEFFGKADVPYYGIESIVGEDGTVYLTVEATHAYRWGDAWMFYLVFGGMGLLWVCFVVVSVYVGRHPEKFSKNFIRLFFKEGYVRTDREQQKR